MSVDSRLVPCNLFLWPEVVNLVPDQKLILADLFFNPQSVACGCYLYSPRIASARLGMNPETIGDALDELQRRKIICFDKKTSEIFVFKWFRFWKIKPDARWAIEGTLNKIESKKLKQIAKKAYKTKLMQGKVKEEGIGFFEEETGALSRAGAASLKKTKARFPTYPSGVKCWNLEDESRAGVLVKKFGPASCKKAAQEITKSGEEPLPSRVEKILAGRAGIPAGWRHDEKATLEAGRKLEIEPGRGESMECFRARIAAKIEQKKIGTLPVHSSVFTG